MSKHRISLFTLLLSGAPVLASGAVASSPFFGSYESFSRACQGEHIQIDRRGVSFEDEVCPTTVIESSSEVLIVRLADKPTCAFEPIAGKVLKIEMGKAYYAGEETFYDFYWYASQDALGKDSYYEYCAFRKRPPE